MSRIEAMPRAAEFKQFLIHQGCREGTATSYLRIANRIHASGLSGPDWLVQESRIPDPRAGDRGSAKKTVGMRRAAVTYYETWKNPNAGVTRRELSQKLLSSHAFRRGDERLAAEDLDVLNTVDESINREPLHTIVVMLNETGARIAEVCGLQLEDVHWDSSEVMLHGKRGKSRLVSVTLEGMQVLKNYVDNVRGPQRPPGKHLFYGKRWLTPIWTTGLNRDLRELKVPGESGYFTPHQVRHRVATTLVQEGTPLSHIRDTLGHESIGTLDPYLKSTRDERREAMERRMQNQRKLRPNV